MIPFFWQKIYVGRRSMCMGDDANHPNMYSFRLSGNLEAVKKGLSRGLPYSDWVVYAGKRYERYTRDEDGVCVLDKLDSKPIFSVSYACFEDAYGKNPIFKVLDENWYLQLLKHPYLFCE